VTNPRTTLDRLNAAQGARYAGGDPEPVRAALTDDVVWHVPGRNAIAGEYRGIEAVLAYFQRRRDLPGHTFRLYPGELLVGEGDHVAMLTDGTAGIDGVERRWSTVGLYRLRDERIAVCWLLPLDPASFDETRSVPRPADNSLRPPLTVARIISPCSSGVVFSRRSDGVARFADTFSPSNCADHHSSAGFWGRLFS
jgi:ketosteroid isomerase-like protein